MHKFHFDIKINEKNKSNAGTKATEDCRAILISMGFEDLQLHFIKHILLLPFNITRLFFHLAYYHFRIPRNSFIVVQYPLKGVNRFFKYFIRLLQAKGCKVACIIHDLDSLRSEKSERSSEAEIKSLNAYDAAISHNSAMTNWLTAHGFKGIVHEIGLFDYLTDEAPDKSFKSRLDTIAFAGNLGRGNFLHQLLSSVELLHVNLYGLGLNKSLLKQHEHTAWCGSFSPEQIVHELQGSFGLVWDGDGADGLSGLMGNYMRINTPHKTSLYIVSGLPVITSKDAAIAPLIQKHNLGILVNSLSEIPKKLLKISKEEYGAMRHSVSSTGKKLAAGHYLQAAIASIQTSLFTR